jgi:hypothetical protein
VFPLFIAALFSSKDFSLKGHSEDEHKGGIDGVVDNVDESGEELMTLHR